MALKALLLLFGSTLCSQSLSASTLLRYPVHTLPLGPLLNNKAATTHGDKVAADFDGNGGAFDGTLLPTGTFEYDGLPFALPSSWSGTHDNVLADSQVLRLEKPTFAHELHFLYSGDGNNGPVISTFTLQFADGSTSKVNVEAKNWYNFFLFRGAIITPYHFERSGTNFNSTNLYQWSTAVPSESPLESIVFPPRTNSTRMHVFALSLSQSVTSSRPALSVRRARFSQRWELLADKRAQVVEVTLANLLPASSLSSSTALNAAHTLEIVGAGIKTVKHGIVNRLVPADQARIDVLITGARQNGTAVVQIRDSNGKVVGISPEFKTSALVDEYTPDQASLAVHETPTWFNSAKYGIFIHWGVYSKPAFAPPLVTYAEWYDWNLRDPPNESNPTWVHHLNTYGPDVVYDDFFPDFTASKFNASEWVDLFDRAGAKYFVLTTKHHDGFALFDSGNTTNRNSVQFGPKRDLVAELLATAKAEKPDLHRGTYYSMPEWFSPDYAKYGFSVWPGGLAHNAFNTSEVEPYTGRIEINDYLEDLQLPQMVDLAVKYDTEIMWCDIGGPNRSLEFAAQFYNHALAQGRAVTLNDRCGILPDFDTPEYATFGSIQTEKWESSEGMDPHSYGLNLATNASEYKNGTTIIQTLVDIVSKNGNFLLDIGPTAEGEIIAPMVNGLLEAGSWLDFAGDCIYDTEYWYPTSEDTNPEPDMPAIRFTTTANTFCIIAFGPPTDGKLIVNKRLPLLPGDDIVALRPGGTSKPLKWSVDKGGAVTIEVSSEDVEGVQFAWPFQIKYKN